MRILLVSSYLPFPLDSGGHVRLYNILKELSKSHKITLVCEIREYQTQKDIEEVRKYCEGVYTIPHKKPWSPKNLLKAGFSSYPLLLTMHTLPEMRKRIVQELQEKTFDLIHVETFYVMQNVPKTYLPIVLVEHNIEYKVYGRFANTSQAFARPLLFADIAKIKYWEEKFWRKATKVVAVSKEEQLEMKGIDAGLVPNGVDTTKFKIEKEKLKKNGKEKRILFIGNFKWIQNQKAALKILEDIWPKIELRVTSYELRENVNLWIVGKSIPDKIKAYQSKTVLIDEDAPEATEKIYHKSDILLAPIEVGGGSSYKIIEAMASGVPVVTTELGIKGIAANSQEHALVGKTDEELADGVIKLLTNEKLYDTLRKNARAFIETTYNWQVIAKELEKIYTEAMSETL